MSTAKVKRFRGLGLRVLVALAILGVTLRLVRFDDFLEAIRKVRLEQWLFVVAVSLLRHFTSAWKWWLLLGEDAKVPFSKAVRAYYWGLFANLYLPGIAGGDIVKATLLARNTNQKTRIVVRSLADRLLDFFSLLLVSLGGALFLIGDDRGTFDLLIRTFLLTLSAAFLGIILIGPVARRFSKLPDFRGKEKLERALVSLLEIKKRPGIVTAVVIISVLGQVVFVLLNASLARSSTADVTYAAWFFAWPLAKLVAIVPITAAGLGVREGALAALLVPFGANAAHVVAAGLLWQTVVFACGLLSGLISLFLDSRAVKGIQGTPSTLSLGNPRKGKEQSQPAAERIEILLYHSISNENGVTSISPATFAGHLRILKEEGYSVIDPSDLIAWRERQVPLPPRAAILSFDDGFKDFADQAFPLIREQGWNPIVFLPTGCIGSVESWGGANEPPRPIMDWNTIGELSNEGVLFGGHTDSHPDLTRLSETEVEQEIINSIEAIAEKTGQRHSIIALPYGKSNARVRRIVEKHCKVAVGTNLASARLSSDPMDLPRIEMHYFRDLDLWRAYLRREADFYFRFRVVLRKIRGLVFSLLPTPSPKRVLPGALNTSG